MNLNETLRNELKKDDKEKKTISVVLETAKLEAIDKIIAGFNILNPDKVFTRQKLIELSINHLIEESEKILEENGITDDTQLYPDPQEEEKDFDTVIFPAQMQGFEETFLGEDQWYYVRLKEDKLDKIKYVACYVGKPVSAITHYAKVDKIEPIMLEKGKRYIIKFAGKAIKLDNPVPLGKISSAAVRANRYVKLDTLLSAKKYADLL